MSRTFLLFLILIPLFANICISAEDFASVSVEENSVVSTEEFVVSDSSEQEENTELSSELVVTSINFSGLKRTKNWYLQSRVKKFLNKSVSDTNLSDIEGLLQEEGLFETIDLSLKQQSETEASVEIVVKEKISFLPIPFVASSEGSVMGGGFVMDTNAFGIHDMFAVGGIFSANNMMGFGTYFHAPKTNGIPGFSLSASGAKGTYDVKNLDDELIFKYKAKTFSAGASVLEKLGEYNTFSVGGSYRSFYSEERNEKQLRHEFREGNYYEYCRLLSVAEKRKKYESRYVMEDFNTIAGNVGWSFKKSSWNGWFLSSVSMGVNASCLYSTRKEPESRWAQKYSAMLSVQQPVLPRLRLIATTSGVWGRNNHISEYSGKSSASVTILPSDFLSERMAGGFAGLEYGLLRTSIGLFSVYGAYECAVAQDWTEEYEFCHGPGFGMKLYLSKLAFPALSMGFSYNVTSSFWEYAFSLGFSM